VSGRGAGAVLAAAAAGALAAWAADGAAGGLETLAILLGLGAVTAALARGLARRRAALGGLGRQAGATGLLIAGQLVAAGALFAGLMLVSSTDVLFLAIAVVYSCALGAWVARGLAARLAADLDAIRGGLAAVEAGERDVRIATAADDELAGLARQVERMAAALGSEERARAAADRARRDLLASISHDLRTPLTSIRLLAEAIEDDIVDEDTQRRYAGRLGIQARAFGALIDDLFELSRIGAGEIRWTMQQVEIAGLVEETVEAMRPQAEAGAVDMVLDLPGRGAAARANPERIQRVLFNLIQNAIRHTPADGSVTVRAEPIGDAVEVEVADTGSGIAAGERARVFEPFVQGAANAARTDGHAGLGLAIARAIVEAHGGRIWLAEAPLGTRVRFSLPAAGGAPVGVTDS
jgi:signal transduction histidine kinase